MESRWNFFGLNFFGLHNVQVHELYTLMSKERNLSLKVSEIPVLAGQSCKFLVPNIKQQIGLI